LADAHAGNTLLLSNYLNVIMFEFDPASEGLYYSVMCAEEAAFTTLDEVRKGSASVDHPLRESLDSLTETELTRCQAWDVARAPDFIDAPVSADIPTLVLSGEYDPITPPEWGRMTAENLNPSYFFEFPATSHGVFFTQRCAQDIVSALFEDPTHKPDASCIERIDPFRFDVP
jgi:pimeloyl-ACP methyl ester carboxylesterase